MYLSASEEELMGLTNLHQGKSRVLTCNKCKKEFDSHAKLSDAAFLLCIVCNVDYKDGVQQAR